MYRQIDSKEIKLDKTLGYLYFIDKNHPLASNVGAKKRAKALGCKLPPPYFFNKSESFRKEQRQLNGIPDLLL